MDSYLRQFFWNPPNSFRIQGDDHCCSAVLCQLFKSLEKVICLLSSFLNTFSNIVLVRNWRALSSLWCQLHWKPKTVSPGTHLQNRDFLNWPALS